MNGKISVIIPVYNAQEYLEECINSVLAQSYCDIEIICIDDGSSDESLRILRDFEKKDPRMVVVHQENRGVSAARNRGLEIASGEYIGFVDSDDYCMPEMYEVMLRRLREAEADVSVCSFVGLSRIDEKMIMTFPGEEAVIEMNRGKLFQGHLHNKLIKRALIGKERFDESIAILEDLLFLCPVLYCAKKVVFTGERLYFYRENPDSALLSVKLKPSYFSRIDASKKINQFFLENGLNDLETAQRNIWFSYYVCLCKIDEAANKNDFKAKKRELARLYRKTFRFSYLKAENKYIRLLMMCMAVSPGLYHIANGFRKRMIVRRKREKQAL